MQFLENPKTNVDELIRLKFKRGIIIFWRNTFPTILQTIDR